MTPYGYVTVWLCVHVWNCACNHLLAVTHLSGGLSHTQCSQAGSTWLCRPMYDGLNMSVWAQLGHLAGMAGTLGQDRWVQ